jgi:hypothetical protein
LIYYSTQLFLLFIYSFVHTLFEPFLPPVPRPLPLPPIPPHFQAEPVLPFSPILLKRCLLSFSANISDSCLKISLRPGVVIQTYNPSYSGCGDREDRGLRAVWGNSTRPPSQPIKCWAWWSAPVIAATWEAEGRIVVQANLGINTRPCLKNNQSKKSWWHGPGVRVFA